VAKGVAKGGTKVWQAGRLSQRSCPDTQRFMGGLGIGTRPPHRPPRDKPEVGICRGGERAEPDEPRARLLRAPTNSQIERDNAVRRLHLLRLGYCVLEVGFAHYRQLLDP
jgi:hypothetical protein